MACVLQKVKKLCVWKLKEQTKKMEKDLLLTLDELIFSTKAKVVYSPSVECAGVFSVATDSRNVKANGVFFPLLGEFQDGHKFIAKAIENGASVIVADEKVWASDKDVYLPVVENRATVIAVENTLYALQAAAAFYVKKFPELIKVGITGSNGKTTTKELVSSVLETKYQVIKTEGNFNSETGLPLSVFNIRKEHEIGVFELGMNRVDEIKELANVLFPNFAIITNIGTAHIGILGTKDNIAKEKKNIFYNFSSECVGFVPENDEYVNYLKDVPAGKILSYGEKSLSKVSNVRDLGLLGTSFDYEKLNINLALAGKYNFSNALSAVALGETLGLSASEIKAGIENVKPLGDRSNIIQGNFTVVKDCYNANADSMKAALDFYGDLEVLGKKTFVLGDMLELGSDSKALHEEIGEIVVNQKVNKVIFVGKEMTYAYSKALDIKKEKNLSVVLESLESYEDKEIFELAKDLEKDINQGDLYFFKGSRGIKLERIADKLSERVLKK